MPLQVWYVLALLLVSLQAPNVCAVFSAGSCHRPLETPGLWRWLLLPKRSMPGLYWSDLRLLLTLLSRCASSQHKWSYLHQLFFWSPLPWEFRLGPVFGRGSYVQHVCTFFFFRFSWVKLLTFVDLVLISSRSGKYGVWVALYIVIQRWKEPMTSPP